MVKLNNKNIDLTNENKHYIISSIVKKSKNYDEAINKLCKLYDNAFYNSDYYTKSTLRILYNTTYNLIIENDIYKIIASYMIPNYHYFTYKYFVSSNTGKWLYMSYLNIDYSDVLNNLVTNNYK